MTQTEHDAAYAVRPSECDSDCTCRGERDLNDPEFVRLVQEVLAS